MDSVLDNTKELLIWLGVLAALWLCFLKNILNALEMYYKVYVGKMIQYLRFALKYYSRRKKCREVDETRIAKCW